MSDSNKPSETRKRPAPWLFRLIVKLPAAILIIFVTLGIIAVLSPAGRTLVSNLALNHLPLPNNFELQVNKLKSPSLGTWKFESLLLTQDQHTRLIIKGGEIDWALLNIINGQFQINRITASQVHVFLPAPKTPNTTPSVPTATDQLIGQKLMDKLLALEDTINQKLKHLTISLIPSTLTQLSISEFNIHQTDQHLRLKVSGGGKLADNDNLARADLNLEILAPFQDVYLRSTLTIDYNRNMTLSLMNDFMLERQDQTFIGSAKIKLKSKLQAPPLYFQIMPSTVTINDEEIEFSGLAKLSPDQFTLTELNLKAFQGQATSSGHFTLSELDFKLDFIQLNPALFIPQSQKLLASGTVFLKGNFDAISTSGTISITGDYANQPLNITTDFALQGPHFHFENSLVKLGQATASAEGLYTLNTKLLELTVQAQQLNLQQIADFNIEIPSQIELLIQQVATKINFQFPNNDLPAELLLTGTGQFSGTVFSIPGIIDSDFEINLDQIKLNSTRILMNDTNLIGQGVVNWLTTEIDLAFTGEKISPATLAWLPFEMPSDLTAALDSEIKITGNLLKPDISIKAKGPLAYQQLALTTACEFSTNLEQLILNECQFFEPPKKNQPTTQLNEKISNHTGVIQFKPLRIDLKHEFFLLPIEILTKAAPATSQLRHQFELEGKLQGSVDTVFAETTSNNINKDTNSLQLQDASADLGFFGSAWNKPLYGGLRASLTKKPQGFNLKLNSLGLDYGENSYLTLQAKADSQTIQLRLNGLAREIDFKDLPYASLEPFTQWPAQLRLNTTIDGDLASPLVSGEIEYTADIQQINALGRTTLVPLKIVGTFTQPTRQPLNLDATLYKNKQLQSEFQLETNALSRQLTKIFTQKQPPALQIESNGQINLSNLNLLLNPLSHQFNGLAFWSWQWNNGLKGQFEVNNGSYQHLIFGTTLTNIELQMDFDHNVIRIERGTANDLSRGLYSLQGTLAIQDFFTSNSYLHTNPALPKNNALNTDLRLALTDVKLIDRPDIETLASGTVQLAPSLKAQAEPAKTQELTLSGQLQLQPLEIHLDRTQSNDIPELEIIRYNPRFQTQVQNNNQQIPIGLALDLNTNQQAFLRGKGINAELKGNIAVRGTLQQPNVSGFFNTIRGDAEILGKRFNILTGELRFDDNRGLINIEASHSKVQENFTARVFGSLDNLDVSLKSDPPLPEDETLSRLLFGKTLNDISAIQALRIAAAVRSLSTQSSGLNPIETTRNLLDVDQITLDSENTDTGNENYKIGVGKYVNDKVYVEIQRSSNPAEPWGGKVQIELTPTISLETSTKSESGVSGIDLKWRRDY